MSRSSRPTGKPAVNPAGQTAVERRGLWPLLRRVLQGGWYADAATTIASRIAPMQPGAEALERMLWGGYAMDSCAALIALLGDPQAPVNERAHAAWALLKWHYAENDLEACLRVAQAHRTLAVPPHRGITMAEVQCLLRLGQHGPAEALLAQGLTLWPALEAEWWMLHASLHRATVLADGRPQHEAEDALLAGWNRVLAKGGLEPLQRLDATRALGLDNLGAAALPMSPAPDEMVSVVVPARNARDTVRAALRSLQVQTWTSLEIIVVDDASDDGTALCVKEIAADDPRVRLLQLSCQQGAYAARNAGMRMAQGAWVTVHDSDDWSHPRKIERQMAALKSHPEAVASLSHWVRVHASLEVAGSWRARGRLVEENLSSLLIRRSALLRLGDWDEVRVGADAEFCHRLRCVHGESAMLKVPDSQILSFALVRGGSLTQSGPTHLRSLFHGLRWHYADAYRSRAERLRQGDAPQPKDEASGRRRFPVPLGQTQRPEALDVDLLLVADLAMPEAAIARTLALLASAPAAGLRTAVFHWRRFGRVARAPLDPAFHAAWLAHDLALVCPGDVVRARWAVCTEASVADHLISPRPEWVVDDWVVSWDAAAEEGLDARQTEQVVQNLSQVFGGPGTWFTDSSTRAQTLALRIGSLAGHAVGPSVRPSTLDARSRAVAQWLQDELLRSDGAWPSAPAGGLARVD